MYNGYGKTDSVYKKTDSVYKKRTVSTKNGQCLQKTDSAYKTKMKTFVKRQQNNIKVDVA
jgi:ribosomal protein S20